MGIFDIIPGRKKREEEEKREAARKAAEEAQAGLDADQGEREVKKPSAMEMLAPPSTPAPKAEADKTPEDRVVDAIRLVYDPEIPVNIYEMGLIYDVYVNDAGMCDIKMTLTSPQCPAAQELPVEVKMRAEEVPDVKEATVDIVWDPPWEPGMMSEMAKLELGMY